MQKVIAILEKRRNPKSKLAVMGNTKLVNLKECLNKIVDIFILKLRKLSIKLNFMTLITHSKQLVPIFSAVDLQDFQLLSKPYKT